MSRSRVRRPARGDKQLESWLLTMDEGQEGPAPRLRDAIVGKIGEQGKQDVIFGQELDEEVGGVASRS